MRHGHSWLIGVLVAVALVVALIAPGEEGALAQGDTIYVDADATAGANDGSSWDDAFVDLQPALDAAQADDEIWVAAGTYKPTAEHGGSGDRYKSFQMMNGVALYGGFDPSVGHIDWDDRDWMANLATLSGDIGTPDDSSDNCYHVFYHPDATDLDSTAVLDGFTITGGNANGDDPHPSGGGGMYNSGSSPAITNCVFVGNSANEGGGMSNNSFSSPTLINCIFSGNSAAGYGGGMYNSQDSAPTLADCTFSSNSSGYAGGGMHNGDSSSPALTNCSFEENSAVDGGGGMSNWWGSSPTLTDCTFKGNSAGIAGGGMSSSFSSPTLTNCTFADNSASSGGGMNNGDSSPTLTNCTFSGNAADDQGGGMANGNSSPVLSNCTFSGNSADRGGGMINGNSPPALTNCTFTGNSADYGGGIYNANVSVPTLTNCTFVGNSAEYDGGAIYNDTSSPSLTNCILWGDNPDEIFGGWPTVTYSDIQGGYDGEGNIDADPFFVDPAHGDFHLGLGSPCIDVGDNDAPYLPDFDFEGDARVLDGDGNVTRIVDMGVDEVAVDWPYFHVYLPVLVRGY